MPGQKSNAKQLSSLGETPAEARARMKSAGSAQSSSPQLRGEEVPELLPQHIAAIREAEEGFKGTAVSGGTVEDAEETTEPPTPSKAMEMIRQLGQEKIQFQTERDSALNLVERYRSQFGDLD
jgi:hypothetical protein